MIPPIHLGVDLDASPKEATPSQSKRKRPNNKEKEQSKKREPLVLNWDWGALKVENEASSSNVAITSTQNEVIEITSSEEESPPKRKKPKSSDFRHELKILKSEKAVVDKNYQELQNCFRALTESHEKAKAELEKLGIPAITQLIKCDVCQGYMQNPTVVTECGHTFCQACLHEWFSIARARRWEDEGWVSPPEYTCPLCRRVVHRRPTVVYALKEIVSSTMREILNNPNVREPEKMEAKDHHHAVVPLATNREHWEEFFPFRF
ncbi:hypothetical protein E1B28_000163 [Marasmius oreades]|uniref:RING-type domain-containing protein n=1 Tax=Marasmius oreades TaxID=181124 RepID=A0A9P7V0Y2_9AGAR|nr:uncharacterized protein E1B28_000163 [Marasmius oreades]KAG7098195.1 hypothetical protein E1B28_000163 [Marasmius oreades]